MAPIFMPIQVYGHLIEQVTVLAQSLGEELALDVVQVAYQTHAQMPVLRVDIRHRDHGTGLEDCAQFSRLLEPALDETDWFAVPYTLEVSSPGIDRKLTTERELAAFRGFPVCVTGYGSLRGQKNWEGTLLKRENDTLYISHQGRTVSFAWAEVASVQLIPHP